MNITSIVKSSFVDFEPNIACVVFTQGCNMTCPYCHNYELIHKDSNRQVYIDESEVFDLLKKRKALLDGLVISGGEPTLHKDLPEFIQKCKDLGYLIKLDTNGTNPKMLESLIDKGLLDYVAIDIKTIPEAYPEICGLPFSKVEKSIQMLMDWGQYEFRTTLYPEISKKDIEVLCETYSKYNYVLQQYRPTDINIRTPYDEEYLKALKNQYSIKIKGV